MKGTRYKTNAYEIVFNPDDVDDGRKVDPGAVKEIKKIHPRLMDGKPGVKEELKALIKKYPQEPTFRNFLTTVYLMKGEQDKAFALNYETRELFPEYVYAAVNRVYELIETKHLDKVPEVLGNLLEIGDRYPYRKAFHISEVIAFNEAVIRYLIADKQFTLAKNRIEIYDQLGIETDTDYINPAPFYDALKYAMIRAGEVNEWVFLPVLQNKIMYELYCNTLRIDQKIIREILKLPSGSLRSDLTAILMGTITNYEEWLQEDPDDLRIMEHHMHALLIAAHTEDEKLLPAVLQILSQPDDFLEFWYDDFLTQDFWKIVYALGNRQLEVLKDFMLKPGIDFIARSVISQAVHYIPHFQPERRPEVIEWYRDLMHQLNTRPEFLDNPDDVPADLYLGDMSAIGAKELEQEMIETHYNYLPEDDEMFRGVANMLKSLDDPYPFGDILEPVKDIAAGYQEQLDQILIYRDKEDLEMIEDIRMGTYDPGDEEDEFYEDAFDDLPFPSIFGDPSVGRNDPCPCGSGKKYKKCCMLN